MNLAVKTGPGFFAANTTKVDDTVPLGQIRLYCARIECYGGPLKKGTDFDQIEFKLLAAMSQDDKRVARALVALHDALAKNLPLLKEAAR